MATYRDIECSVLSYLIAKQDFAQFRKTIVTQGRLKFALKDLVQLSLGQVSYETSDT
jgi:hypothetical protein